MRYSERLVNDRLVVDIMDDDDCEYEAYPPFTWEVCSGCHGAGKHVHRAIDEHGITAEEFADDPDFERDYYAGVYDVECETCHGRRVMPEIDWDAWKARNPKEAEAHERHLRVMADDDAISAMERRYGC